jgi:hypothetical protein
LAALDRIAYKAVQYADKLDLLRAYSLVFIRMQRPDAATLMRYVAKFDQLFPAETREENFELSEMLVYLQSPKAATKLVAAMREAPSRPHKPREPLIHPQTQGTPLDVLAKQEEQIHYALQLRKLTNGWTAPLHGEYFDWFVTTAPTFRGGNTFASANATIATEARNRLSEEERTALQPVLARLPQGGRRGGPAGGGGRGGIPNATPNQMSAITAMDQALADQTTAVSAARAAVTAAIFAGTKNDADLRVKVEQLTTAELALANARAEQFTKLQSSAAKLNAEQIAALIAQSVGGPGGRGGGGGRGGP